MLESMQNMQGAEFAKYANLQICNIQNMNNAIMQNMKIFKNEDMQIILMCNMQICKDKPTKETCQTKYSNPNLPNLASQTKPNQKEPTKPNLAKRAYQTYQIKPICICFNSFPVFVTIGCVIF